MTAGQELRVEIHRGADIESVHRVHAVVADRHGSLQTWGDRIRPTIPRSAIKTIQAIPLVRSGATDAFQISREELALSCSSHSGEPEHVDAVLRWLGRIGLSETDLECGPDTPISADATQKLFAGGGTAGAIYNCCSGKHAGFLSVTRHLGEPTAGYIDRDSPIQRLVTASIEAFTDVDLSATAAGRDGCGIPVFALPLERLAFAMARLVDPTDLDDDIAAATVPVVDAAQQAFWVSGTGRTEVDVTAKATEPVVMKTGAEGVFMAALPERGLGVALKADDGAARASDAAIRAILGHLGAIADEAVQPPPITNKSGVDVGAIRVTVTTPAPATMTPSTAP
ncbi:MAG: asparaginase [Acidimicrobiales bacterium]